MSIRPEKKKLEIDQNLNLVKNFRKFLLEIITSKINSTSENKDDEKDVKMFRQSFLKKGSQTIKVFSSNHFREHHTHTRINFLSLDSLTKKKQQPRTRKILKFCSAMIIFLTKKKKKMMI